VRGVRRTGAAEVVQACRRVTCTEWEGAEPGFWCNQALLSEFGLSQRRAAGEYVRQPCSAVAGLRRDVEIADALIRFSGPHDGAEPSGAMFAQQPTAAAQPNSRVAAPAGVPAPFNRSPVCKAPYRASEQHRGMAGQVGRLPSPSRSRAPLSLSRQDSAAYAGYHGAVANSDDSAKLQCRLLWPAVSSWVQFAC